MTFLGGASLLVASSCSNIPQARPETAKAQTVSSATASGTVAAAATQPANASAQPDRKPPAKAPREPPGAAVYHGTGVFVNAGATGAARATSQQEGDITLNFEDTDIQEVVKTILGDSLHQNYIIDPAIKGNVNLQTSQPLSRDDLLPILETLLHMNGAALIKGDSTYRIVPLSAAARSSLPPSVTQLPAAGYRVQVIPLRYIAATEMQKILTPLLSKENIIQVDEARNLLTVAGTGPELAAVLETVKIFDVNWLKGMSIGMYPLHNGEPKQVTGELNRLFTEAKAVPPGIADMIRFVPIERLNAILVITPQPRYLDQIGTWIERLDVIGNEPGLRLFVYDVKNRDAKELADLLNGIFGGGGTAGAGRLGGTPPARLAPGLEPVTMRSVEPPAEVAAPGLSTKAATAAEKTPAPAPVDTQGLAFAGTGLVSVYADEANNSIVVLAAAQDYKLVEAALGKLDVVPLQVLVEASILEVGLTDELRYGIQWTFNQSLGSKEGIATLSSGASDQLANGPFPGFTYSIVNSSGNIKAILSALATDTNITVLSNPALMVLDNQAATIRVGDQVPVRTTEVTSIDTSAISPLVYGNIEYRDTGVLLTVKPQVNPGGLVTLDITQEVNDVSETKSSGIDSPTINQRRITTIAAVQSGETVVLGGLIRDRQDKSESGVPFLYKLPVIGKLFGSTSDITRRTELVVVITPRVVRSPEEARLVSEEFRKKLKGLAKQQADKAEEQVESPGSISSGGTAAAPHP